MRSASRSSRCARISPISIVWSASGPRSQRPASRRRRKRTPEFSSGVTSAAAGQAPAFHAPDQQVDAILAEERFVLEYKGRHAPMAGIGMVSLIAGDDLLITIGV